MWFTRSGSSKEKHRRSVAIKMPWLGFGYTFMLERTNEVVANNAEEHYLRAREHLASRASGSLLSAIAELTKVVAADPDYKDARVRLNNAIEEERGILEYISEFEQILASDPNDVATHYRLADYLRAMGRDDEAVQHWRIVAKLEYPDWSKNARKMLRKHYQIIED